VNGGEPVILVEGVRKAFGSTLALQGVDLSVETGTVQALLGRNGAGKSTLVRILSTLLEPDAGRAWVGGADVTREPRWVRPLIGLAGQAAAVDPMLTARENLELVGRLYGLGRREARGRAGEVLERLSLSAAADRRVFSYSGGMRRRVDLGASLVGRPLVLIMDEPTTGLDPATRRELWGLVEELAREGSTVLLTTQYLEEADYLANQIAVIEHGRIVAAGTSNELKDRLGQDLLEVRLHNGVDVERVRQLLVGLGSGAPVADMRWQKVTLPTDDPVSTLLSAGGRIEQSEIVVEDLGWRRPTLDDVFLTLTSGGAGSPGDGAGALPAPTAGALPPPPPTGALPPPPAGALPPPPAGSGHYAAGAAWPPPPRRRRRLLASLVAAVAVVVAGLAVVLVLESHTSAPQPRHAAAPVRRAPAAAPAPTGAGSQGITKGLTVALGSAPGGLTADANGNLWATLPARGAVVRVNAATGRTQTFQLGGAPTALAAAFDRIWVAGSALAPLASLNLGTGQALSTTQLTSTPTAIAVNSDDHSACTLDSSGTVTHIDSTGTVLATAHLSPGLTGVACGEGWIWAAQPSPPALVRMGAYGGSKVFNGGPSPAAVTLDGGVWSANRDGTVTAFDPQLSSLRVTREVKVAPELDGIYAAENDPSLWAISKQTNTVYEISAAGQPSLTGTFVLNSPPVALARVGQAVWVATENGNLTQLRY
jgi:daunorubicin resistance ABC transporter ATP-binding subunit